MRSFAVVCSGFLIGAGLLLGSVSGLFEAHLPIVLGLLASASGLVLLMQLHEDSLTPRSVAAFSAFGVFAIPMLASMAIADPRIIEVKEWGRAALQAFLLWVWICFCLGSDWNSKWLWRIAVVVMLAAVGLNLADWAASGFSPRFQGMSVAKNSLGATGMNGVFLGCASVWLNRSLFWRASSIVLVLLSLTLLFASSNRSTMAAIALALVLCAIWPSLSRSAPSMAALFCGVLILSALMPHIYLSVPNWKSFETLNDFSEKYMNMRILSGRDDIWPAVIEVIGQEPVFGHGAAFDELFERKNALGGHDELSPHNLYLSLLLRSGLVGLIGFVAAIACFWRQYYLCSDWWLARWSFGFFVAILLRANFDVTLTHVNLQVGFGEWAIIASGVSAAYERSELRQGRLAHAGMELGNT
jgi:O-antigen ligase